MKKINRKLNKKCGIYIITNVENGKRYVGSSKDLYGRLHDHMCELNRNSAHNAHLQSAWNKYGQDSFEYGILEYCELSERFKREQYYIDVLKPEYNLTTEVVANFGHTPSKKTKQKISETLKRRYAAKEIFTYKQQHNWISVHLYNVITFEYLGYFNNLADVARRIKYKHGSNKAMLKTLMLGKYIVTRNKFKNISDLKNYVYENILKLETSPIYGNRYLIVKNKSNSSIQYFKSIRECAEKLGISQSTIMKNLTATEENPYVHKKIPTFEIYFTKIYQHLPYDATPVPEGLVDNKPKSAEACDGNAEVNVEIKESTSPYSVEIEPEKSE